MRDIWKILGLLSVVLLLPACSGDSFQGDSTSSTNPDCETDPTLPECIVTATSVSVRVSKREVKSDNSETSTVTATVLDENNAAMKGVQVTFNADRGKLSASIVETDENGEATTEFSSGTVIPYNGTVYVEAAVDGAGSAAAPISIVGSTIAIEVGDVSVSAAGVMTQKITAIAKDAGGQVKYNVPVTFVLSAPTDTSATTATATLNPPSGTGLTDADGEVEFEIIGTTEGKIKLTVDGLGDEDFDDITVSTFLISLPTSTDDDPVELKADNIATQVVTVSAPAAVTTIRFVSSIGVWVGSTTGPGGVEGSYIDVDLTLGPPTATLKSDRDYGMATVYVLDFDNPDRNDSIPVALYPAAVESDIVDVQSDVKTLQVSSDTVTNSTTISAKVMTDVASNHYPVNEVGVLFTMTNTVGGGEHLSRSFAYTGLDGVATATFYAGTTATSQSGVQITATVVDPAVVATISDTESVEIGGTAGSVSLSTPRIIGQDEDNDSINVYNMSALVADGTGTAVSGATVTLHFWPAAFFPGVWYDADPATDAEDWKLYYLAAMPNEDTNENLINDTGEDLNNDGELTPAISAAGVGPSTVVTGKNGAAAFDFTYLKDYAPWVQVRARASTRVLGTEMTTTTYFIPNVVQAEIDQGWLEDSPYKLVLEGQPGTTAVFPGTFGSASPIQWQVPDLIDPTSDTYSSDSGSFFSTVVGTQTVWKYTIPAGAVPNTQLIVSAKVTSGFVKAEFFMYVNVLP